MPADLKFDVKKIVDDSYLRAAQAQRAAKSPSRRTRAAAG